MNTETRCTVCKLVKPKEEVLRKIVNFRQPWAGGRTVKSRTVSHICAECRAKDPDWNREIFMDSPGVKQHG